MLFSPAAQRTFSGRDVLPLPSAAKRSVEGVMCCRLLAAKRAFLGRDVLRRACGSLFVVKALY